MSDDATSSVRKRLLASLSSERARRAVTVGPPLIWLLSLLLVPTAFLVAVSFAGVSESYQILWEFSIENYVDLFDVEGLAVWETPFVRAYAISLFVAAVTTVLTLVLAMPVAYFLSRRSGRVFQLTFYFVLLPFFTVYLVRAYSWYLLFGGSGAINASLTALGLIDEPIEAFGYGLVPIIVALTHAFFPYMLFTLYASFDGLDFSLVEAARDLGASRTETFRDVVLPLVTPGIVGGCVFVFVPALGAFVTPQLLGQSKIQMIGQLMGTRINSLYAIGYGSAVSLFVVLPVLLVFAAGVRYSAFGAAGGE